MHSSVGVLEHCQRSLAKCQFKICTVYGIVEIGLQKHVLKDSHSLVQKLGGLRVVLHILACPVQPEPLPGRWSKAGHYAGRKGLIGLPCHGMIDVCIPSPGIVGTVCRIVKVPDVGKLKITDGLPPL